MSRASEKNWFRKSRDFLEVNFTNWVKNSTGSDPVDWIIILILLPGGMLLLFKVLLLGLVSESEMFNGWILWFTTIVVLKYTKETFWLKKVAQKELKQLRESELDKFLPIIVPREGAKLHKGGNLSDFVIRNIGKGIAKEIEVLLEGVLIEGNFVLIPREPRTIRIPDEHKSKVDDAIDQKKVLKATIIYTDIYDRIHKTSNLQFHRDSEGNYLIDRGEFTFEKGG